MLKRKLSLLLLLLLALPVAKVKAQIVPDETLGEESSVVTPVDESNDNIEGGAARGGNLFHSFREFNVGGGRGVDFINPAGIENILTRVTGGNVSNILGRLGVRGEANLFLINPNGILFGEGASSDIGGSFLATTAESILFNDNNEFSAVNPNDPPLLTINTPIGLQLGNNSGEIINRANLVREERFGDEQLPLIFPHSKGEFPREEKIVNTLVGLEVERNQNITLVGGNIILDGGGLSALGGKIQLGGLATEGVVTIDSNGDLEFPQDSLFSDISLINDASIDVQGNGGGDIIITGQNIEVKDGSTLFAGIRAFEGSPNAKAGDIVINGIDSVVFDGVRGENTKRGGSNHFTNASNQVGILLEKELETNFEYFINGEGQGGDIEINTKKLDITNGARINNVTHGEGDTGNIFINATGEVNLKTDRQFARKNNRTIVRSFIINSIFFTKDVGSGKIEINTPSLNSSNSSIASIVFRGEGGGNTGNIEINTNTLKLIDNGRIVNLINDRDIKSEDIINLGDIIINAEQQVFLGESSSNIKNNFSRIINVFNGKEKISKGDGNTGNIKINTRELILADGSKINNRTEGKGTTGDININAKQQVFLDSINKAQSAIFNTINDGGNGNAGDITIRTNQLTLTNGSLISENIANGGEGNLGKITIEAKNISLDGKVSQPEEDRFSPESSIYSTVNINAIGNGGKITINTENLSLTNKGRLFTSTLGTGNAGNVSIKAENIDIKGGNIDSEVGIFENEGEVIGRGSGNGGTVDIDTNDLNLSDGGTITVSSEAEGNIGQISIEANSLELSNESKITAETNFKASNPEILLENATENDIDINIDGNLILRDDSLISAKATEEANGGNLKIDADFIIAFPEDNDIIASAQNGRGGNIDIETQSLLGINERNSILSDSTNDIDASSEFGLDGNISLKTPNLNPTSGLFQLVSVPIDAEAILAQDLCRFEDEKIAKGSSFVITGRGGLTPTSEDTLGNIDNVVGWANREDIEVSENGVVGVRQRSQAKTKETNYPVVQQSQGWVKTSNGSVWLVANAPETLPQKAQLVHPDCGTSL